MDKYSATWISHSSISDYLACPRSYYLKNIYKDPNSNNKLQIVSPALSLGIAVHDVLESLSSLATALRFRESLIIPYEKIWQSISGEKGGFTNESIEKTYKDRGQKMLSRVMDNPGPLAQLAVKIKGDLPNYYISETDNIILCGKLDWLQYFPQAKSVHIIDFKTSKNPESESSLQLPIYLLLATNCQKYKVEQASYWYLQLHDKLTAKTLPDLDTATQEILAIGQKIAVARKLQTFKCPHGGCPACEPFERLLKGEGKKVAENKTMRRDSYLLSWEKDTGDLEKIL